MRFCRLPREVYFHSKEFFLDDLPNFELGPRSCIDCCKASSIFRSAISHCTIRWRYLMPKHSVSTILGLAAILAAPLALLPATRAFAANALTSADTDKDGTLDKAEVDAAASAQFDKLDKDKDGTLDKAEVGKRLSKADFAAADTDNDKTLT